MAALRGLTSEQRESICSLTAQLDDLKTKLDDSTRALNDAMQQIRRMTAQYAS